MVENITKLNLKITGLFRSNYLATFHVREMAKTLKTSHVTLLPHLKGLQKNKVLLSKTAGRNKVFSLNNKNISTRDYIVLAEKVETIEFLEKVFLIKRLTAEIAQFDLQGTFLLFGSYVKGYQTKESDIDILYVGEISSPQKESITELGEVYAKKVSLKTSTQKNFEEGLRAKDPLIIEVIKDHIILQNAELFVNALWRYYGQINQS